MKERGTCVLLPLDGSENSLSALGAAIRLASSVKGHLHIVHVSPVELSHDELLYRMGLPSGGVPGATVHSLVGKNVVNAIVDRASEPDVGYIVLATHGETGETARLMGSVTEGVMSRANARVLMIPPRARMDPRIDVHMPVRNILVPLDGSPSSARAVPEALFIAGQVGATVWLLHIPSATIDDGERDEDGHEPGTIHFERMLDRPEEFERLSQEFIERFVLYCSEYNESIPLHFEVSLGYPPQEISRITSTLPIDMIVATWHGNLAAGRAQVLKSLLHQSTCPVLLVKCEARARRSHLRLAAA